MAPDRPKHPSAEELTLQRTDHLTAKAMEAYAQRDFSAPETAVLGMWVIYRGPVLLVLSETREEALHVFRGLGLPIPEHELFIKHVTSATIRRTK